jgi:hypothetical protein
VDGFSAGVFAVAMILLIYPGVAPHTEAQKIKFNIAERVKKADGPATWYCSFASLPFPSCGFIITKQLDELIGLIAALYLPTASTFPDNISSRPDPISKRISFKSFC